MNTWMPIVIVVLLAGVGVLADYFLKIAGNGSKYISYPSFFTGMLIYTLTAFGWFYAMKYIKLSTLGIFYSVTTIILLALVGTIFFKEHLSAPEILGIVFGIISLIILTRFS